MSMSNPTNVGHETVRKTLGTGNQDLLIDSDVYHDAWLALGRYTASRRKMLVKGSVLPFTSAVEIDCNTAMC